MSLRRCILVLGMHRSGTSAITGALGLLGATLPRTILGAGLGNTGGHWESEVQVAENDALLSEFGSTWDDWRKLPSRVPESWLERIAETFEREFGDSPLSAMKDPRICRLLPVYLAALQKRAVAVQVVLVVRHPLAVAASLAVRNGFSQTYSSLIWLRHMLDAELVSRSLPRTVVRYDAFLDDWRAELAPTMALAQLPPGDLEAVGARVDKHVEPDLLHHRPPVQTIRADTTLNSWLARSYRALAELRNDPLDMAAQFTLDQVRSQFDPAAELFGEATFREMARLEQELDRLRRVEQQFEISRKGDIGVSN